MPKVAQILEWSSGVRQVCVSVFFLFWSLYKTNSFHFSVGMFSNRSQRTSNVVETLDLTHSPAACVPLLCFYHILTSFVIYYWTDVQTWNPFGKHLLESIKCKSLSQSRGARKWMVHTVQLLRHDVYCPLTMFFGSVHDYLHLNDGPLMMHINRRGVTIHIPCDSIRFRLLPFNFDYFDSIM